MGEPILSLDFDGVIHSYTSGWCGARVIPDPPVPGALEFVARATESFDVQIFSCRSHQWDGRRAMRRWLYYRYMEMGGVKKTPLGFAKSDVPEIPPWWYDIVLARTSMEPWEWEVHYGVKRLLKRIGFPKRKPPAHVTLDDRAITFDGRWPNLGELLEFVPWNRYLEPECREKLDGS